MPDRLWHYAIDGTRHGPVPSAELKALADKGMVTRATLVWTDGLEEWKPAGVVTKLFPAEPPPVPESETIPLVPAAPQTTSAAPRTTPGVIPVQTGDATGGLIPYKNPCALIGYYLSIAALLPMVGAVFGIIAFCLGIAGLRARARHPQIKGAAHAWIAIILGGLCALAYVGVFVALILFA